MKNSVNLSFNYTFILGDLATNKRSQSKLLGLLLKHLPPT